MSKIFSLGVRDLIKGLAMVVATSVLTLLLQIINDKGLSLQTEDWKIIAQVGITSGIGYLLKNYLTAKNDKILGKF